MLKLICLNAYLLRDTAFSIVFKSYHLTLKVNVEGNGGVGGESYDPFSISPFSYFFESANFKLVLHFYARQMILILDVLFSSQREKKKINMQKCK